MSRQNAADPNLEEAVKIREQVGRKCIQGCISLALLNWDDNWNVMGMTWLAARLLKARASDSTDTAIVTALNQEIMAILHEKLQ